MPQYGFPADDYTPHGYLANPHAVAHSWSDGEGGCLRTSREHLGMAWLLPWALQAKARAELIVTLHSGGETLTTRADFAQHGLFSPHHTSQLLTYRWQAFGLAWDASFVQISQNEIGMQVVWSPVPGADAPAEAQPITLSVGLIGWRQPDTATTTSATLEDAGVSLGEPYGTFSLRVGDAWVTDPDGSMATVRASVAQPAPVPASTSDAACVLASVQLPVSSNGTLCAMMRRSTAASGTDEASEPSGPLAATVGAAIARARAADAAFWSRAARLVGDWPDHWRRGWVYDLETTRMCIFPPGGVFTDVWPAWMIQWPRAVVAEGTLDVARLAYADPQLALRAALSLFRDTAADNIPCIFQHGEPNMVAADGSVCGTSPAWCVPFYNLERLYLQTLDRAWLAEIYPHLARYVDWWLRERSDGDSWAVYKCTWEAGEDDTPRLDPERRGDNVVSAFVRPVELQATMALSAGVLARFAEALGQEDDILRWRRVEAVFHERTQSLWDGAEGRFRDWDSRANAFLAPTPSGDTNYWGIDPLRHSALAFTPALTASNDATRLADEQVTGLRRELQHYAGPPWTLWASWSYVVLEAAARLGAGTWAGDVAARIIERVYRELDAREISAPNHPTPGVAREYWPLDLDSWASCEGYAWGANTASLLMRQVFGFFESADCGESADRADAANDALLRPPGWTTDALHFELEPHLPDGFLEPGREYRITNLPYRGAALSLGYRVRSGPDGSEPAQLTLLLAADVPTTCVVTDLSGAASGSRLDASRRHAIALTNGVRRQIVLRPAPPSADPTTI